MATVREVDRHGGRGFQAIVRKRGHSLSRVHATRAAARSWAGRVEAAIDTSGPDAPFDKSAWLPVPMAEAEAAPDDSCPHAGWTVGQALEHYGETVSPLKKGCAQEVAKIAAVRRGNLAGIRLDRLTPDDVRAYIKEVQKAGLSASTVRLRAMLLRALYRDARALWKLVLTDPFDGVKLPEPAPHRTRRLQDGDGEQEGEEARLRAVFGKKPAGPVMLDLLDLALATGMRQGELLAITAGQVRRVDGVDTIEQPDSKNGDPRLVVLSTSAAAIVKRRAKGKRSEECLFPWKPADLRQRWNAARKEAGVEDYRWHDLRHEALSRMGAAGMHVGMLMGQSGHRTVSTLKRYLNPTPKEVKKLLP